MPGNRTFKNVANRKKRRYTNRNGNSKPISKRVTKRKKEKEKKKEKKRRYTNRNGNSKPISKRVTKRKKEKEKKKEKKRRSRAHTGGTIEEANKAVMAVIAADNMVEVVTDAAKNAMVYSVVKEAKYAANLTNQSRPVYEVAREAQRAAEREQQKMKKKVEEAANEEAKRAVKAGVMAVAALIEYDSIQLQKNKHCADIARKWSKAAITAAATLLEGGGKRAVNKMDEILVDLKDPMNVHDVEAVTTASAFYVAEAMIEKVSNVSAILGEGAREAREGAVRAKEAIKAAVETKAGAIVNAFASASSAEAKALKAAVRAIAALLESESENVFEEAKSIVEMANDPNHQNVTKGVVMAAAALLEGGDNEALEAVVIEMNYIFDYANGGLANAAAVTEMATILAAQAVAEKARAIKAEANAVPDAQIQAGTITKAWITKTATTRRAAVEKKVKEAANEEANRAVKAGVMAVATLIEYDSIQLQQNKLDHCADIAREWPKAAITAAAALLEGGGKRAVNKMDKILAYLGDPMNVHNVEAVTTAAAFYVAEAMTEKVSNVSAILGEEAEATVRVAERAAERAKEAIKAAMETKVGNIFQAFDGAEDHAEAKALKAAVRAIAALLKSESENVFEEAKSIVEMANDPNHQNVTKGVVMAAAALLEGGGNEALEAAVIEMNYIFDYANTDLAKAAVVTAMATILATQAVTEKARAINAEASAVPDAQIQAGTITRAWITKAATTRGAAAEKKAAYRNTMFAAVRENRQPAAKGQPAAEGQPDAKDE